MDIKRKIYGIQTWGEKTIFLDISSTNIDKLVTSLYHCVETRSIEVVLCYLSHFRTSASTPSSAKNCRPIVNSFMRQILPTVNKKHFFVNIFALSPFAHNKGTKNAALL
jgi:hypothetical protein